MKRVVPLLACAFGTLFVGNVLAQNPTFPHYPPSPPVKFESALSAEEVATEFLLNASPDLQMLKAGRTKKGDVTPNAVVNIFGSIRNNQGSSLCGLVLANGQFMFSCSPNGTYSLNVTQDSAGLVTLFGFVDSHFPYKAVYTSGGRADMTLTIAPPVVQPVTTSVITFTITDGCNNGIPIDYKFYDVTNNLVWPSSSTHYSTVAYNGSYSHDLTCNTNANVCYGARSANYYWGVDVDHSKSCADCCISCQQGYSLSRRLTC